MKVLVINWQDRENPQAGGAELHLHEIFGRIAKQGHSVTLLCGGWRGCAPRVTLDGMQVHRVGTRYSFPFLARRYFRTNLDPADFDVLVEDINKVPLFTMDWGVRSVVALVPHLFGGTAFQEVSAPMAAFVWLAERPIATVYAGAGFHAISESTRDDLVERGVAADRIRVIHPGIDTSIFTPAPAARASTPVFTYLGRLKRYKGVDIAIRAFAKLAHPAARLDIAGTGDHRPALETLVHSLDLGDRVRFLGFVSEEEKLALLRRSWALVFASPKEGWGITNLEAAACGTPVIASASPGLRESVVDGQTGFLVPHGDEAAMAAAMGRIAASPALVAQLGQGGRRFAETFSWDRAASETIQHLESEIARSVATR